MRLLFDFFPILVFFIAYKFSDIFTATAVFIIAAFIQITFFWLKYRRFEKTHVITFLLGVVLGGATLFFHDELFIKWKPTAIYWIFSIIFFGSQYLGQKPLLKRMMENNINLPDTIWQRLNLSWVLFFLLMGVLNLYVVYNFDTDTWVNFKLFGIMGLTLLFIILQALYLGRHVKTEK